MWLGPSAGRKMTLRGHIMTDVNLKHKTKFCNMFPLIIIVYFLPVPLFYDIISC